MKLNNGLEIPQIGVGTWTLRGETARQNVRLALGVYPGSSWTIVDSEDVLGVNLNIKPKR